MPTFARGPGCKAGDKCLFPHHKVDEQPNGNCENCTTIGLRVAKLGCVGFSKRQTVPVKSDVRYVKQVPRKRKDHRLAKDRSNFFISEVAMLWKIEERSHEETERQQRCARSKAWNLAKNIYKIKENDNATFYSPAEEWVVPAAWTKEPEER